LAPWLSESWGDEVEATITSLPHADDSNGSVRLVIAVAKKQEVRVSWRYVEGAPAAAVDDVPADLDLSVAASDAADLFSGRVDPSVSFMRGRLKASGDGSMLLAFLASTASGPFARWRDQAFALADPASRPQVNS
jgi:hypothetical protein